MATETHAHAPQVSWDEVRERLHERGLRWTPQRRLLVEVLAETDGHITGAELVERVREQDPEEFGEYFHKGILVNASLKGGKMSGSGVTSPNVTYFSITTEAPDEIASGNWMNLMGEMGLAHSTAVLKYLYYGENEVKRESKEYRNGIARKVYRVKPVVPKGEKDKDK